MGFESGQAAGIDHDARHGDRNERRTIAYPGRFARVSERDRADGFRGWSNGAVSAANRLSATDIDMLHGTQSGLATKKLMERA